MCNMYSCNLVSTIYIFGSVRTPMLIQGRLERARKPTLYIFNGAACESSLPTFFYGSCFTLTHPLFFSSAEFLSVVSEVATL